MVRGAVDAVGGLGELADAAGVSTDALQAFGYAATQVGLSNEELQRSLQALTRRISDAATCEQAAQQAFSRLGISFRDTAGNARATEAVMAELAERIAGLSDPVERTAAATAVFGDRLGQRMIPFLLQGRDGLERLTAQALRFGAIADADLIAKADEASCLSRIA
jgi:TP901 family phage tail tape measure protein